MPGHLTQIYTAARSGSARESRDDSSGVAGAHWQRSGTATGPLRAGTLS
jgi:hypothetical protein